MIATRPYFEEMPVPSGLEISFRFALLAYSKTWSFR